MGYNFVECNRNQMYLMPPSLLDWLDEGDLAFFIIDAVEVMDISGFYKKYRIDGKGGAAFDPSMMICLMLYAYCIGERSSRRIERLCERDIGFRVITANRKVDHSTISRFRKSNEKELEQLFTEVLKLCSASGILKVGVVALDGTKMGGNAALSSNRTQEHIEVEVKKILAEAQATDETEDRLYGESNRGDELPEEFRQRASRLERLRQCKERLEKTAKEAVTKQQEKVDKREQEELESGKKKRGKKPKEPEEVVDKNKKANVTDPESRIMKGRRGYVQGYNAQAVVTQEQIIIAAEVTQEENDVHQLKPMLDKTQENLNEAGVKERIEIGLADAGYWEEESIKEKQSEGINLLVSTKKDWKQRKAMREEKPPRGRIPGGLSERQRMERKMSTKSGKENYRRRGEMIESVFGQVKGVRGIREFFRRGLDACASEWKLICMTHNLLKLFRFNNACNEGCCG